VAAVEVMIANSRIQELIREDKAEYIPEAVKEGTFFHMQTLTDALIQHVVAGRVDQEVAAAASPNRHDFMIALDRALKEHALEQAAAAETPDEGDDLAPAAGSAYGVGAA
jgi:Tfp pilus assembly ATPase PilU